VILLAVILLALVKGLLWATVIPGWYGPDETSHYVYVQGIVEDHWLPRSSDPNAGLYYPPEVICSERNLGIGFAGEFHAEPFFNMARNDCGQSNPSRHASAPVNAAAGYRPLYYAGAVPFYLLARQQAIEVRLAAVRLWSVLLGALAAAAAWLAMRHAFPESRPLALAATILFIFQPMNSQQTAVVNNDALLLAVAALFWWQFFVALRFGASVRRILLMAGLAGIAYVAKPQGIFLASVLPIVALRGLPRPRRFGELARLAVAAAAPLAAALLVSLLLVSLAGIHGLAPPSAPGLHGVRQYLAQYLEHGLERPYALWITSFWGYFGWYQVDLPAPVYVFALLASLLGLVGSFRLMIDKSADRTARLVTAGAFLVPAALIQLLELYVFRSTGILVLQGRSFLMLLIPLIVLLLLGWQRLLPRAAGWGLAPATVVLALTLNLVSLARMVDVFYG